MLGRKHHYAMEQSYYIVESLWDGYRFDYVSIGSTIIEKAIIFYELDVPFLYSLLLGDIEEDGSISAESRSNNGDMIKNLTTVYRTIEQFLNNNPRALVAFQGNTAAKTRLYRIAISKYLDRFLDRYLIWGVRCDNGRHEPFQINQSYRAFFVTIKSLST
ncbi:hypothetical protein SAMN04487996_115123 [Dyadobacter soli]|uniref:Uncharacterized protein n=2 Tax=Dyadobacter soli TaxID=659014 RepID=A0A1G7RRK2_9BACT|nr:hypothetical protein SAMN04487996_115123 [Dyadobacter soli]